MPPTIRARGDQSFNEDWSGTNDYNYTSSSVLKSTWSSQVRSLHTSDKLAPPCMDDHDIAPDELVTRGAWMDQSARVMLKALYPWRGSVGLTSTSLSALLRERPWSGQQATGDYTA